MTTDRNRADRIDALHQALKERILVLDGAVGTYIQDLDLTAEHFGGPGEEGCNEVLNLTQPDIVRRMHTDYRPSRRPRRAPAPHRPG